MLAQNFKTAADLGIREREVRALVKVLGMLERDEIPFSAVDGWAAKPDYDNAPTHFNMILVQSRADCGTAACILGWARHIAGDNNLLRRSLPDPLEELFFCTHPVAGRAMEKISVLQAAIALRSYLTTGEPNWADALTCT